MTRAKRMILALAALWAGAGVGAVMADASWNDPAKYNWEDHKAYVERVERALGTFEDIEVWDRSSDDEPWQLKNGAYIPVTVDGKTPSAYHRNMISDRPMVLPIRVEGFDGGDGQSMPYSVVGRMPGSNPETQWVFLVRKYYLKDPKDKNFVDAGDVAIIGHHPRTGATTYFQFYDPAQPKPARVVVSPFSGEAGMKFWSPLVTQAKVFQCQRCHNTDPFIHTPWIDQVRVSAPKDGAPYPEPMVPSNPLGSFSFIDDKDGQFKFWEDALVHLDAPKNECTACHRIAPSDFGGFYQTSTKFVGVTKKNPYAVEYQQGQTKAFQDLPWMPPVGPGDFYDGQTVITHVWKEVYEESAREVNSLNPKKDAHRLKTVPAPPAAYREIMVDRPNVDSVPPASSLWIVDTRMRANTDATLAAWRFYGHKAADDQITVAPVVYRRHVQGTDNTAFKVVFVGDPLPYQGPDTWSEIAAGTTFDLNLGDHLGLVLYNDHSESGAGLVPYTDDTWINPVWSDGTTKYVDGLVTRKQVLTKPAKVGDIITFEEETYQTYSFEMRNAQ